MKEPSGKTWITSVAVTFCLSLGVEWLLGEGASWRKDARLLEYSLAAATLGWLFAMARWHRKTARN